MAVKIHKKLIVDKSPRGGTQTNSYIIIHNTAGGTAKACWNTFDANLHGRGRDGVACQYTVDDKEGYQMLEDNWGAGHCGLGGHYAPWGDGVSGVNNSNTLGIEVADGSSVNAEAAIENCIELTRYLMQAYSIPASNVLRHGDVQNKGCPATIMKLGKWDYIKTEIEARNKANKPINLDISELSKADMVASTGGGGDTSGGGSSGSGTPGQLNLTFHDTTTAQESLPNANTSDNWVDMHEIKGITLHFYPPYHNCVADSMADYFKALGWNRNFHYKVDKDTKIDFDKEPQSGQTTGGNRVGTSKPDFEVTPKDPLYSGVNLGGGGGGEDTGSTPSDGTTPDIGGISDNAQAVWTFFTGKGFTKECTAGIMGNLQQESGIDPTRYQSGGGPGRGMCQWTVGSDRFKNLEAHAKSKGKDWKDLQSQCEFLDMELQGKDPTTLKYLKKYVGGYEQFKAMTDVKQACKVFEDSFERAGIPAMEKRYKYAEGFYSKFSGGTSKANARSVINVSALEIQGDGIPNKLYNYLIAQGCSKAAACGIIGNCQVETDFDNEYNKNGIGIFRWTDKRKEQLEKKVANANTTLDDVNIQIRHMWAEFSGEFSSCISLLKKNCNGLEGFKNLTDPQVAASIFYECYIQTGGSVNERREQANEYYQVMNEPEPKEEGVPFGWPIPCSEAVQSCYGYRIDNFGYNYHHGIDISAVAGSSVHCYANGKVEKVVVNTKLEGYVRISHQNGLQTIYGSLWNDGILVEEGQEVEAGQCIGLSGTTSANGLMHVHFEMMVNGENIDPLVYVKPGGGNRNIPECYYGVASVDISDANDNVTWDNIDKGKICFASADNNTHTYIDSNLFNNQHPKYTLSVGAFFYDEFDLVEKTGKVNWPATEKVLIQQCAKALYDEGFTSTQLWREFDLNRAPSPFLYLDKDKWRAFCAEVDKQVDWLNDKYGKVTSTYVPNELLQDSNDNEFKETAPDGGTQPGGGGSNPSNGGGSVNLNGSIFIGDSWTVAIKELAEKDGVTVEAVGGKSFNYFYTGKTDRLKDMKKNPTFIYVFLGINNMKTNVSSDNADKFFERLKQLYPNTPLYAGKVIHLGKAWSGAKYNEYGTVEEWNKACDKFNEKLAGICSKHGITLVSIDDGLLDSKGLLDASKTSDGVHLKQPSLYYENVKKALNAGTGSNDSGNQDGGTPSAGLTDGTGLGGSNDTGTDIKANPANAKKYAYVKLNNGCKFYKSGNTASEQLDTFSFGKEVYIISGSSSSIFYHCRVAGKTGYIRAKNLAIVSGAGDNKLYGTANKESIAAPCTIFPGTRLYSKPSVSSSAVKTYSAQAMGTIVDVSNNVAEYAGKEGQFYKVKIGTTYGWAKAYRVKKSGKAPLIDNGGLSLRTVEEVDDYEIMLTSDFADKSNIGKYCYVANTVDEIKMYKEAKEGSAEVEAGLVPGDELKITGVKNAFYYCTFNGKKGYVKENMVVVLSDGHGKVDPGLVKSNCWILFDGSELYDDAEATKSAADLRIQDQCVVLDSNIKNGTYKLKTPAGVGWVKALAVTFDQSDFRTAVDTTNTLKPDTNPSDGSETNPDDGGESDNTDEVSTVTFTNGDFESGEEGWTKEGNVEFKMIQNPDWGKDGHYPYHGKQYARIRNTKDSLAGIKHDIEVAKAEGNATNYVRVLFYIKPVTQEDFNDGPTSPDAFKGNGISVKLLDKNNKVKHEKKITINNISDTVWTRVGCVINNCTLEKYTLLIGNNKKFDLLIDEVTVECITRTPKDDVIGDSDSSSGLTSPGAGATSIDNGGVMVYEVGTPTNKNAKQPSIKTIITQEEYEKIMEYSISAKIDFYTNSFEPDDKDLEEAKTVGVKSDSRLQMLTEELKTLTENMIRYKVIETGPGSIDHCVKPVDELNVLFKNVECNVDPIYPDLVVPPKYTTSTNDMMSKNSIPMTTMEDASISLEDMLDKSYSYEYDLLAEMNKRSTGKPINYMDPYPYDDKITDLENHSPKVLIDEIESRLYSCNHPGCPIAHPMAKNFAMLNDMAINQSKLTEKRLVRLENTLATMTRYLGRMASRVNINCVYYGGQTTLGKYKCIRCLRDDRVHDGATVTIDQCLTCTRYEPIVGQVYDILDETGFNGSAILDDMQMSYMNLQDMKNLNQVENRSTEYHYIDCNKKVKNKPKSLIDEWQKADKKVAIDKIKKEITNKKEQEEAIKALQPSDYLFMMDWTEQNVDLQQPDVKAYPTEKIAAKYYNQAGDSGEVDAPAEESTQMGIDDEVYESIASGEWVDTRETDDSVQTNKYTSLDFYFENFNLNRTGYEYDNGLKGNIGLEYTPGSGSGGGIGNDVNGNGAEIRKKITEMALTIVQEHKDGKAYYSNSPRTVDHEKPQKMKNGMIGYDCTSLVSCCYKHAGLSDFYSGTTGQGNVKNNTLLQEVLKKGGKIWFADTEGMNQALPGDVLMSWKGGKLDKNKLADGSGAKASHAMIYMGDGKIAHASKPAAAPNGIRYEKADYYITGSHAGHSYFLRPKSLVDADAAAANNSGGNSGVEEKAGTIDGVNYVMALKGSKCTQYKEGEGGYKDALGNTLNSSKCNTVASHNLPYGTKVYIPAFKNKQSVNPSCIFTVTDTGNAGFDFDICCSPSVWSGSTRLDVYVTEWGTGKASTSHTYAYKNFPVYESLWKDYVKNGGTTYKVTKFNNDDANITSQDFWKKYS